MKRVLIISPHFPPVNAADHQRVRMALPYLEEGGWRADVVAVRPEKVEGSKDEWLARTVPANVPVTWADAWSPTWTRRVGIGQLAYRAWFGVKSAAETLLAREKFDLVFFSTTQFPFMSLGPRWRKKFGVPFVLDVQDPWWGDYYERNPGQRPPGGRLKFGVSQWLSRRQERATVPVAANVVCVSPGYVETFKRRYPQMAAERFTVLPFGAPEQDFAVLDGLSVSQTLFDPSDGKEHWVYIGRGGDDMGFAVKSFFLALKGALVRRPELGARVRIHFAGTDYAPRALARKTIEPLAREFGVDNMVGETTDRLPYFETLKCLRDASALFVPGSDDPAYTASKIYPYVLARKPLLAVFHRQSSVGEVLNSARAGTLVQFDASRSIEDVAGEIGREWFDRWPFSPPATDWNAFAPYTARSMTQKLCSVFDRAVEPDC